MKVSIVRCEDYTPSKVLRAVKEAVDLIGGMQSFVTEGQNVLLKPNLLTASPPDSGVCTHPSVMEAVVSLAHAAGGYCAIGDSPCINAETPEAFNRLVEVNGIGEVLHRTGASLVRFDDSGLELDVPDAAVFRQVLLAEAVLAADVLINLPKFKTHDLTILTLAVKNLFGCVPGRRKIEFHFQAGKDPVMFSQLLVDIARAVRPSLNIMDGIVGMDGQGPSAGRRRTFNLIMASPDPSALDAAACMVAGIDPLQIPTVRLASEQGLLDIDALEIVGHPLEKVRITGFQLPDAPDLAGRIPAPVYRTLRNQLVTSPVFNRKKCVECGVCVEACPVKAIRKQPKLKIDYSACIRCYCCREACPEHAIDLRKGRLRYPIEMAFEVRHRLRSLIKR